jgi:transposase
MTRTLPSDILNNIKAQLNQGKSISDISTSLAVSKGVISKYRNKWYPDKTRNQGGRPSIVCSYTKNIVRRNILSGKLLTATDVHKALVEMGYNLSTKTAANVLKSLNFFSAIKKKKPFMSKKHKKARLSWAKRHEHWTSDDWQRVVFSDETKINIWGSDGCKYYWSRPGDELKPHHIEVTVKHGGGSLMMWGCITYHGPGYACQIFDGTMKSEDYQHILDTSLNDTMEYYNLKYEDIYFQQDNDPKHKSRSTMKWLDDKGIKLLEDWPAQSPDLNPIEHIWHHLKLKLSSYDTRAKGIHDLWERCDKEWNTFTEKDCQMYIDSMPKRIKAVIDAKGGQTKY